MYWFLFSGLNLLWRLHDIHMCRRCNDTDAHTTAGGVGVRGCVGEIPKSYFFFNILSLTVKILIF